MTVQRRPNIVWKQTEGASVHALADLKTWWRMISAFSGRHARWCPQIQRICLHWQLSCFTVKRRSSITICSTRAIMSLDWLVRGRDSFGFFFTRRSSFFERSYPWTHIFHVHNAIIACLTQLLMSFNGFHATQVEDSDNHALFFECKRHHFLYLKQYWHSTTSQACNG